MGLLLAGCNREPGSTKLTSGTLTVECDEAVFPAMNALAAEFRQQYPDARIEIRCVEARAATADFVNDSVKVIVCARPLNDEERNVLTTTKTWFEEYHVAQSAIAVIVNPANPVKELRMGQVDSICTGQMTSWPGWRAGGVIDLVTGSVDASTNEVFRRLVLHGKAFAQSATPMKDSPDIVEYVGKTRNAVGIVGVGWLKGVESEVKAIGLSRPGVAADSTQPVGKAYSPHQAYVYQGYYPASTPVTMYTRDLDRTVSLGFISFATGPFGQKVFLNNGLVPVTMPVRLIQLTSE
ncbi:MAG: substrate-binding domain-containing protein [Nitrosomonas sp.]